MAARLFLGCLALAAATAAQAPGSKAAGLREVARQGQVRMLVADEALVADPARLGAALRSFCDRTTPEWCQLMVWTDRSAVPGALPMSDYQVRAQRAQYNRNRSTKHERLLVMRNGENRVVKLPPAGPSSSKAPDKGPSPEAVGAGVFGCGLFFAGA